METLCCRAQGWTREEPFFIPVHLPEPRDRLLDTLSPEFESCPKYSCSFVPKDTLGFTELSRKFGVLNVPSNGHLLTNN